MKPPALRTAFAAFATLAAAPALAQSGEESPASSVYQVPQLAEGFAHAMSGIAHGRVEEITFHSSVFGEDRVLYVYLPAEYYHDPDASFPLLVLRHGGGFKADGWVADGFAPAILDNLIAKGEAVPMIVAMPASWMPGELGSAFGETSTLAAATEVFEDMIPTLRERYRVAEGRDNLALAGLSAGGGQSFFIGTRNSDKISALGVFSTGAFGGINPQATAAMLANPPAAMQPPPGQARPTMPSPFDAERDLGPAIARAEQINADLDLFYISVGDEDSRYEATAEAITMLRNGGIEITATQQSGGHVWPVWSQAIADFAPRLFRD